MTLTVPSADSRSRAGYTLVEMIVAMVLVAALMSSVWSIMSLYNGLLTSGRNRTTEQQLIRSLFQLVGDDLNDLNVVAESVQMAEFGDTLSGLSTGNSLSFSAGAAFDDLTPFDDGSAFDAGTPFEATSGTGADAKPSGTLSVAGTATALRLRVRTFVPPERRPPSDIDLLNELGGGSASASQPTERVAEFQTIIYQTLPWDSVQTRESAGTESTPGLYRIQVDTQSLDSLESTQSSAELQRQVNSVEVTRQNLMVLMEDPTEADSDVMPSSRPGEPLAPQSQIDIIPEVVNCRFEYYDGSTWLQAWDDTQLRPLPVAIRMSVEVVAQRELTRLQEIYQPGDATAAPQPASTREDFADDELSQTVPASRYSRTYLIDPALAEIPGGLL